MEEDSVASSEDSGSESSNPRKKLKFVIPEEIIAKVRTRVEMLRTMENVDMEAENEQSPRKRTITESNEASELSGLLRMKKMDSGPDALAHVGNAHYDLFLKTGRHGTVIRA